MKIQNAKFKTFYFLLVILTFAFLFLTLKSVSALTMSNNNYIIQMGNLNMAAGKPTGGDYKLGITMGQTAPGLYTGTNYKVRAGFQYIHSIIPFRFSVSQLYVDFGILSATTPVLRDDTYLTITNGSANGYTVAASESGQLLNPPSGSIIPDTTCDNGTCTQTTSAAWTSNLTYGFGYRCDNVVGTDCASGFSDSTYYKQFADASSNETPAAVMTGTNVGRNKKVKITYKVNISGTQEGGSYRNFISYIATPSF